MKAYIKCKMMLIFGSKLREIKNKKIWNFRKINSPLARRYRLLTWKYHKRDYKFRYTARPGTIADPSSEIETLGLLRNSII